MLFVLLHACCSNNSTPNDSKSNFRLNISLRIKCVHATVKQALHFLMDFKALLLSPSFCLSASFVILMQQFVLPKLSRKGKWKSKYIVERTGSLLYVMPSQELEEINLVIIIKFSPQFVIYFFVKSTSSTFFLYYLSTQLKGAFTTHTEGSWDRIPPSLQS